MSEDEKLHGIFCWRKDRKLSCSLQTQRIWRGLMRWIQIGRDGFILLLTQYGGRGQDKGIEIIYQKLSDLYTLKLLELLSPKKGIQRLKNALLIPAPLLDIHYHPTIEEYSNKISAVLPEATISKRSLSLMILAGDKASRNGWWPISVPNTSRRSRFAWWGSSKLKEPIPYLITWAEYVLQSISSGSTRNSLLGRYCIARAQ